MKSSSADENVNIEWALADLEQSLGEYLRSIDSGSGGLTSPKLLDRIRLRPGSETAWTARFAPLTLLYPRLQAEALSVVDESVLREITLAHFLLLIFAFADDRRRDGQFVPRDGDVAFAERCREDALEMLRRHDRADNSVGRALDDLHREYRYGQSNSYVTSDRGDGRYARVRRIAAARAAYGVAGTLTLAHAAGCDQFLIRRVRNAFDCLVVALQWADDLADWREDLRTGDENLALITLQQKGLDPYRHAASKYRDVNVGFALLEHGVFEYGVSQAERWFAYAERRQHVLGCGTLVQLIAEAKSKLIPVGARQRGRIEREVLRTLAIDALEE